MRRLTDVQGRWLCRASTATTKTEARRLAADVERRFERQRLGLDQPDVDDGGGTVDQLIDWWIEKFLRNAGSGTGVSSIRKHVVGSDPEFLTVDDVLDLHQRTGLAAAYVFLELNGYVLSRDEDRLYQAMIAIGTRQLDKAGLAHVLRECSVPEEDL